MPRAFSLSDIGDARVRGSLSTCERSAESSSEMAYPMVEGFSVNGGREYTELCDDKDPVGEYECNERVEAIDPLRPIVPNVLAVEGGEIKLFAPLLIALTIRGSIAESRLDMYEETERIDCAEDSNDIFEERRERLLDIIRTDSWSEIGDGPGKGGRGTEGGRDGGGLKYGLSGDESIEPNPDFAAGGKPPGPGSRGEWGMWVGGVGKDSRMRGTGVRLPARD